MHKMIYETETGERRELELPMLKQDIRFKQYIEFMEEEQKFFDSFAKEVRDRDTVTYDYVITEEDIIKDLDVIVGHLASAIGKICTGRLDELPVSVEDDSMQLLIDHGYTLKPGDDLSLMRLYAHCMTVLKGDVGDKADITVDYKLEWHGETYYIEPRRAYRMLANKRYTTGEVIEVLEFQRKIKQKMDNRKPGTMTSKWDFNLGLAEVSMLLRKKGEALKTNRADLDKFLHERMHIFQDLTLDIIFGIRFFLQSTIVEYATAETVGISITGKSGHAEVHRTARLKEMLGKEVKSFGVGLDGLA